MLKRLARIEEDVQKKLQRHDHVQTHPLAMERAKVRNRVVKLEPLLTTDAHSLLPCMSFTWHACAASLSVVQMLEPLLGKGYETMATNPDCADALSKFQEAAAKSATLRSD